MELIGVYGRHLLASYRIECENGLGQALMVRSSIVVVHVSCGSAACVAKLVSRTELWFLVLANVNADSLDDCLSISVLIF